MSDTGSDPDVEASRAQGQADGDRYLGEEDEEDLEMDEEDRLIAQGGIGIPIGPVSGVPCESRLLCADV